MRVHSGNKDGVIPNVQKVLCRRPRGGIGSELVLILRALLPLKLAVVRIPRHIEDHLHCVQLLIKKNLQDNVTVFPISLSCTYYN